MINDNFYLLNQGLSNSEYTVEMARHRWYYYKEGFSPNLVTSAIDASRVMKDELIIDPFNGAGTTTLTASILGYKSLGIEVNPFTSFISKTKTADVDINELERQSIKIMLGIMRGATSPLTGFSTFSTKSTLKKWLFNDEILAAYEGGWNKTSQISKSEIRKILRLALISSAMENCNAKKDGKCLRYKSNWENRDFGYESFLESFTSKIQVITEDLIHSSIKTKAKLVNGDARSIVAGNSLKEKFKLCITSPPYLNTFDYTDIYRPELFLGKFINTNDDLYDLRLKTLRSHVQAKWEKPTNHDFGTLYTQSIRHISENLPMLMHKSIPSMVQAYFEDMQGILRNLKSKAKKNAQLWIIVSNSAYADMEIPVDLIIADIGAKMGLALKEVGVLRHINKRKTKYSPSITRLRESVIIFENKY